MNSHLTIRDDLVRALAGEASRLRSLENQNPTDIGKAGRDISAEQRTITVSAVKKVLKALLEKTITPSDANSWAWLARGGVVRTIEGVAVRVETDYQDDKEEAIAEAVSRLSELGDLVDGTIDDTELKQLIQVLTD